MLRARTTYPVTLNNLTIEEFRAHKQAAAQQANQPPKKQS